jgi:hypothetical protein
MGRTKGSRNKPKLHLIAEEVSGARKPTAADRDRALRELVCALVAQGHSPEGIAVSLKIELDKLKALYPVELEHGATIHAAAVTAMLQAEARDGNVSAMRKLDDMAIAPCGQPSPTTAQRLGKKAAMLAAAEAVAARGSIYSPSPPPRYVEKNDADPTAPRHARPGGPFDELFGDENLALAWMKH